MMHPSIEVLLWSFFISLWEQFVLHMFLNDVHASQKMSSFFPFASHFPWQRLFNLVMFFFFFYNRKYVSLTSFLLILKPMKKAYLSTLLKKLHNLIFLWIFLLWTGQKCIWLLVHFVNKDPDFGAGHCLPKVEELFIRRDFKSISVVGDTEPMWNLLRFLSEAKVFQTILFQQSKIVDH